jgi:hypothetical protein
VFEKSAMKKLKQMQDNPEMKSAIGDLLGDSIGELIGDGEVIEDMAQDLSIMRETQVIVMEQLNHLAKSLNIKYHDDLSKRIKSTIDLIKIRLKDNDNHLTEQPNTEDRGE